MAKTRRKKVNTQPRTMFGGHVSVVVVKPGSRDAIKGVRLRKDAYGRVPPTMKAGKDARETTVGMVVTGVPKGKRYPERSVKRGGTPPPEKLSLVQRAGRKVRRVLVGGNADAA
jgi:hypothetical protein